MEWFDFDGYYKDEKTSKNLEELRTQERQEKLRKFQDFISREWFTFLDQSKEDKDELKDLEVDIFYKQSGGYKWKKIYDLALKIKWAQRIVWYNYNPQEHRSIEGAFFEIRYLNNQWIEIRKKFVPTYFKECIYWELIKNFIVVADPTEPIIK